MDMTENSLDLTVAELNLIYRLCDGAQVQGYDTASALVSLMNKIRALASAEQLPEGQTALPVQNLE